MLPLLDDLLEAFPSYLGLPLGLTKTKIADFLPMVNRCERRLVSTSLFLSQARKLQMVNSVFSSLPTFIMGTFQLHVTIREQVDKYRKHYLWCGNDENDRINAKAAWPLVARPKINGGSGVIDLKTHNEALLLKQLDKFFNRADIPQVQLVWEKHYSNGKLPNQSKKGSFWWRDVLKLLDKFKGMPSVSAADGASCLLWNDCWAWQPLKLKFPELHSFAKNPNLTLKIARSFDSFTSLFNLHLFVEVYGQMIIFQNTLESLAPIDENDTWSYI